LAIPLNLDFPFSKKTGATLLVYGQLSKSRKT